MIREERSLQFFNSFFVFVFIGSLCLSYLPAVHMSSIFCLRVPHRASIWCAFIFLLTLLYILHHRFLVLFNDAIFLYHTFLLLFNTTIFLCVIIYFLFFLVLLLNRLLLVRLHFFYIIHLSAVIEFRYFAISTEIKGEKMWRLLLQTHKMLIIECVSSGHIVQILCYI